MDPTPPSPPSQSEAGANTPYTMLDEQILTISTEERDQINSKLDLIPQLVDETAALGDKVTVLGKENKILLTENRALRETLSFTQNVVEELLSQNNAYNDLLGRRRSNVVCSTKRLAPQAAEPLVQVLAGGAWIGDIWLSSPRNEDLLGEAEAQWKNGEPQKALNTLTKTLQTMDSRRFASRIKVDLLSAAILQNRGVVQRALDVANECLSEVTKKRCWDLMGVCNFIRGRCQIDLDLYEEARQSLLFAAYTPGYAAKVKEYYEKLEEANKEVSNEFTPTKSSGLQSLPIIERDASFLDEPL